MVGCYKVVSTSDSESVVEIYPPARGNVSNVLRVVIEDRVDSAVVISVINQLRDNNIDALASYKGARTLARHLQMLPFLRSKAAKQAKGTLRLMYRDMCVQALRSQYGVKTRPILDSSLVVMMSFDNIERFYNLNDSRNVKITQGLVDVILIPGASTELFLTLIAIPSDSDALTEQMQGGVVKVLKSIFTDEQLKAIDSL